VPVIVSSSYRPPFLYKNRHVNTVLHALLRNPKASYTRERITTLDDDFVDLDFSFAAEPVKSESAKNKTIVLIIHGLEGSSDSGYVKGMVKGTNLHGWDAAVLNFRGCSGEDNKSFGSYHSGQTEDVDSAINHLKKVHQYEKIFLVSYSLGANVMLKYLGEDSPHTSRISASVAVSVPCDLQACALQLEKWYNKAYMFTFLKSLRKKVKIKCNAHPGHSINLKAVLKATTFKDFDNEYTAPAHGFKDAIDYWTKSSCTQYLHRIITPTLIINAQDDPFLTPDCFPHAEAKSSDFLFLETPKKGGHVGFVSSIGFGGTYWHEKRVLEFLSL
jgi:predicted alpha/beta-fold hydrolase